MKKSALIIGSFIKEEHIFKGQDQNARHRRHHHPAT